MDGKREMDYQLVKLLLFNLEQKGEITHKEYLSALRQAIEALQPVTGALDVE